MKNSTFVYYFFTKKGHEKFVDYLTKVYSYFFHDEQGKIDRLKFINTIKINNKNFSDFDLSEQEFLDYRYSFKQVATLMIIFEEMLTQKGVTECQKIWSSKVVNHIGKDSIQSLGTTYPIVKSGIDVCKLNDADKQTLQKHGIRRDTAIKILKILGIENPDSEILTYFLSCELEIPDKNTKQSKSKQTKIEREITDDPKEKVRKIVEKTCARHRHLPVKISDIYVDFQQELKIPEGIASKIEGHSLRLIITGSLGLGKTTYLKKIALNMLDIRAIKEGGTNQEKNIASEQTPIFVNLREYVDEIKENKVDLLRFIAKYYKIDEPILKELLQWESDVQEDKCVLLLDSLDQVSDLESNQLIDEIIEFVREYPNNDYIITSRDTLQIHKLEDFEVIQLKGIETECLKGIKIETECLEVIKIETECPKIEQNTNFQKIWQFIDNWIEAITQKESKEKIRSEILSRLGSSEDLRNLASKPLMLSLIVLEHIKHHQNNQNNHSNVLTEWHIVHRAIKNWLEISNRDYWDEQEQSNGNHTSLSLSFVYELLEFIAYKSIDIGILNISRTKLTQHINSFVKDYYGWDDKQKISNFTEKTLRFLENTYGFSLIKDDNIYSFPHTIFRIYFAIRYIYNKYDNVDMFEKEVTGKTQWSNTISKAREFPESLR